MTFGVPVSERGTIPVRFNDRFSGQRAGLERIKNALTGERLNYPGCITDVEQRLIIGLNRPARERRYRIPMLLRW
jgi:hypothetical protein